MDIVPLDDTLLVEGRIRPQDIAFIRPGQDAVVKISAYDSSVYGSLKSKVERISADTIVDDKAEKTPDRQQVFLLGGGTLTLSIVPLLQQLIARSMIGTPHSA